MIDFKAIMEDIRENRVAKLHTVNSITKVNQSIYMMDYTADYGLDEILEKGVSNVGELIAFLTKKMMLGKGTLRLRRTEGACTTFNAVNPEGEYLFARNYDYKAAPCMLIWAHPENGYASLGITEFNFMLYGNKTDPTTPVNRIRSLLAAYTTLDGINEKGLCIGVVEVKAKATYQDTGKKPITTTAIIRAVLDKCATVDEAIALFEKYDMHDSIFVNYHYQIMDATGRSVIIEYANNEMIVYEAEKVEGGEYPVQHLENIFITEGLEMTKPMGYDRRDRVNEKYAGCKGVMDDKEAGKLLSECVLNYRHKLGWQVITLWSAVYNLDRREVYICAGMDYSRRYKFSLDNPLSFGPAE